MRSYFVEQTMSSMDIAPSSAALFYDVLNFEKTTVLNAYADRIFWSSTKFMSYVYKHNYKTKFIAILITASVHELLMWLKGVS